MLAFQVERAVSRARADDLDSGRRRPSCATEVGAREIAAHRASERLIYASPPTFDVDLRRGESNRKLTTIRS
eukprot:439692-Prymnesium_polylepis.1